MRLAAQGRGVDRPAAALQVRLGDPRREAVDELREDGIARRVGRRRRGRNGRRQPAAPRRGDRDADAAFFSWITLTVARRPLATLVHASSRFGHDVTGRMSVGSPCSAEERQRLAILGLDVDGPDDDRHDRREPRRWRCMATVSSLPKM